MSEDAAGSPESTEDPPGYDPDLGEAAAKKIKIARALVGALFSLGLLVLILQKLGLTVLPASPTGLDFLRAIAFAVTLLNVGAWMYFPLDDLSIQRRWFRTAGKVLPAGTSELFAILLALVFLLGTTVTSLISARALALAGLLVYTYNLIGYDYVRGQLALLVPESRSVYGRQAEPQRSLNLTGLDIATAYWCCDPELPRFRNRQQARHLALAGSFTVSVATAFWGSWNSSAVLIGISYLWSIMTIVASEVSIGLWRSRRDRALREVRENLRRATSRVRSTDSRDHLCRIRDEP